MCQKLCSARNLCSKHNKLNRFCMRDELISYFIASIKKSGAMTFIKNMSNAAHQYCYYRWNEIHIMVLFGSSAVHSVKLHLKNRLIRNVVIDCYRTADAYRVFCLIQLVSYVWCHHVNRGCAWTAYTWINSWELQGTCATKNYFTFTAVRKCCFIEHLEQDIHWHLWNSKDFFSRLSNT